MAVNFSGRHIKNNVNFNILNELIDQWALELKENQNVFSLQMEEFNNMTFQVYNCQDKLKMLYERIIRQKCLQDTIDQILQWIRNRQSDIEQMVSKLEHNNRLSCKCKVASDHYRENTYNLAESLNSTYMNFFDAIEELQAHISPLEQKYCGISNIEYIAQLLQHQLQQLENIEMKIHKMQNHLHQTEFYKQHVLASLHIKENKL